MTEYRDQNAGDPTSNLLEQPIKTAIDTALLHTWTAMPGIIKAFDAVKQVVEVVPAVRQEVEQEDGTILKREFPVLTNVPVQFQRGGGFVLTHSLVPGDSGIIIFADRCIDYFVIEGGIQDQAVRRKHDMSDAMFIPGVVGFKQAISNFNTSGLVLRNLANDSKITIENSKIKIENSDVEIGDGTFKKLLQETVKDIYNSHSHFVPTVGQSSNPNVQIADADLTENTKAS